MDNTRDNLRQILINNGITTPSVKMLDDIAILFKPDYDYKQQFIELISKPSILPKNMGDSQAFKQALNYYHRVMVKRIEGK